MSVLNSEELKQKTITVYSDVWSKTPFYTTLQKALDRIKDGSSKAQVEKIRAINDKDRRDELKLALPSVCFSGEFETRGDDNLKEHSGVIVLDWDDIYDPEDFKSEICCDEYIMACWVSPSDGGVKALVKILDGSKHREHFASLKQRWPDIDSSGVNQERICFESYDPEIYVNWDSKVYDKIIVEEYTKQSVVGEVVEDDRKIFTNILSWLTNSGSAFEKGERNLFIFKLASACCRFGVAQSDAQGMIAAEFGYSSSFSQKECETTVNSAYKKNATLYGSASFEKEKLVDSKSRKEIVLDSDFYDKHVRPKDVIYGEYVKDKAISIYDVGHESIKGIGVEQIDYHFKMKKQELTLLTGIGGYGKSTFLFWMLLMKSIQNGDKWAIFSPEVNPSEEFYFDLVEILLGTDCTPANPNRPDKDTFKKAYDWVSEHFFYVYPEKLSPTPEYIKERFLELIIKEKVAGCIIDPVNMLSNDYTKFSGRDDRFLETFLSDLIRFSQQNDVYMLYVAHPTKMSLNLETGNFDCPNVFNIAGGAMHNNKCYNILAYHRPNRITDPQDPNCEFHALKIRKQKIVGKLGDTSFQYDWMKRRFTFGGVDPMARILKNTTNLPFLSVIPLRDTFNMPTSEFFEIEVDDDPF